MSTNDTRTYLNVPNFPVPFCADAISDFKKVIFLRSRDDPAFRNELAKLKAKWPPEGQYFYLYRNIPELRAYRSELLTHPPRMKAGSFTVVLITEGNDRYTLRIIPGGPDKSESKEKTSTPMCPFGVLYALYILKGTLNCKGKVENEFVLNPEGNCRFLVECCYAGQAWAPAVPTGMMFNINASGNFRVKDMKTGNVVYTLDTLLTVEDGLRASPFPFVEFKPEN